ncbi:MAG: LysR substrate-binding domain-containing protein [Bacillota bacterium]|nr:LysR substrate-binding domain-containing protein [Bacillota bacterium]
MDIANLKAFYQVAISGNFSKAASELFVSQPVLSRQVAALEKELDLQLFYRQARHVILTDAGRRLFKYAEKIISLTNEAEIEMLELKDLTTGELSLGASTTIANYLLPPVLAKYRNNNPGINLSLKVANTAQIEQMVLENKVDIGLIAGNIETLGLFQEQFAEDELFLVVPNKHIFAEVPHITSKQLNQETFLCREAGSDTQRLLNSLLESHGVVPNQKIILGDTEAIKRSVINNMGIAFLSKYTFQYELTLGLLKTIEALKMCRPLMLIYAKGARLSPAALLFASLIKKVHIA